MSKKKYGGLVLLLTIYAALVMAYSCVIPFSKGPDEYINYQYILFIAKYRHLPKTIAERAEAGVKADWQPLYHLVSGLAAAPISLTPPPTLKVTWEPSTRQLIDIVLPRATLVRTEDERPPYRGVYAVWQMGRWVSMLLGAGTLVVVYLIGLVLWPGQPALATGVTALLVFTPRFLFTHAVLSDDTMLGFWLTLYLLLLVYLVQNQPHKHAHEVLKILQFFLSDRWLFFGLGITAGLAIVTKYTAIPAVAGALLIGGWLAYKQTWPQRRLVLHSLMFIGGLGLTVGWWISWVGWYFNQISTMGPILGLIKPLLPGAAVDDNPTTARLTALFSGQSVADLGQAPGAGGTFLDWAWNTFITFWGVTVFGAEPDWPYPYMLIIGGIALFCLVAVGGLWWGYHAITPARRLIWLVLILHVLLFFPLPLLRFALSRRLNDAAQGRHLLFPAGAAIVMLLMAGWLVWFRPYWRNRIALLTGAGMLIWAIAHLGYLWQAYPAPLPVRTTPGPQIQVEHPLQINFDDVLLLTGYETRLLSDNSILRLDLRWQGLAQAWEDYRTEITLVNKQDEPQLQWMSQPAEGRFPVRAWQPGDIVRDTLYIPLTGVPSGEYSLQLRLLGWDTPLSEKVLLSTMVLDNIPPSDGVKIWQQGYPVLEAPPDNSILSISNPLLSPSSPTFRYRSVIPVTAPSPAAMVLIGPANRQYSPIAEVGALRVFMVDYDWPSGEYHLHINDVASGLNLRVENFDRRYQQAWNFTPPQMIHTVQANFAGKIELLGYDLPSRRVEAGGGIPLVLYWRGLAQMRQDYTMFVQLLDANLQRRGGYDRFARENYNTYLWAPGEIVDDGFAVPVDVDAPDGIYAIHLGWYRQAEAQQVETLPLMQNDQTLAETSVAIGPIKVGGPPPDIVTENPQPQVILKQIFSNQIKLFGYTLTGESNQPLNHTKLKTQNLKLTLYWQSVAQTGTDYTVFVHLRDQTGQIVAQADGPPARGQYPTSLWDAGEIIVDEMTVTLPSKLENSPYTLAVGLYDPATGVRLAVPDTPDDSLILTELELD